MIIWDFVVGKFPIQLYRNAKQIMSTWLSFADVHLEGAYRCAWVAIGPRIPRPTQCPK